MGKVCVSRFQVNFSSKIRTFVFPFCHRMTETRNGTALLNHYTRKEREGGGCVACGAGLKREMTRGGREGERGRRENRKPLAAQ